MRQSEISSDSSGCVSYRTTPSGNTNHGWALRVQTCAIGRSQDVSSNVPGPHHREFGQVRRLGPQAGIALRADPADTAAAARARSGVPRRFSLCYFDGRPVHPHRHPESTAAPLLAIGAMAGVDRERLLRYAVPRDVAKTLTCVGSGHVELLSAAHRLSLAEKSIRPHLIQIHSSDFLM